LSDGSSLAAYLRDRRSRLDPVALGFAPTRRRTPGLRREEVAQRANISPTWYTWLEQGRGGAPSAEVLERIARALMLTEVEREHVFILGLGRPPDVRYQPAAGVTLRLQRVLDSMDASPAIVRTATWDVVAWNRAAAVVLTDYARLPPRERNVLRLIFTNPAVRAAQFDWEGVARFVVAVFRADAARAGAASAMQALAEELSQASPEFAAMWRDNDVRGFGEGVKRLRHPRLGELALEYSAFAVDGRPDLAMFVYTPMTAGDADRIRALMGSAVVRPDGSG
jgi:transcriptional regulator with XRE-family HTH domain